MKAKLIKINHNGNVAKNRKENHYQCSVSALVTIKGNITKIADLRFYSTNTTSWACLWINDRKHNIYTSGGGKSTSYGYNRLSTAAHYAIKDAGFELSENLENKGSQAVDDALISTVKCLGYRKVYLCNAHP